MKKIRLIIIILSLGLTSLSKAYSLKSFSNYESDDNLECKHNVPYLKPSLTICLTKVFEKDNYSLYKCKNKNIENIPNYFLEVNKHNYFVYKDDKFLFTVTNFNKEIVYQYFTSPIEYNQDSIFVNNVK